MKSLLRKLLSFFLVASLLFGSVYFWRKEKPFYCLPMRKMEEKDACYVDAEMENTSCPLELDLGTTNISLRQEILEQIQNKLKVGYSHIVDVNGNTYRNDKYCLNWMKIGPLKIENVECEQEDLDFLLKGYFLAPDRVSDPSALKHFQMLAGRLGIFLFRQRDYWLFDFPKLALYAVNDLSVFKKQFRLSFDQFIEATLEPSYPEVIIKIDTDFGTKRFLVDTGADITLLKPPGDGFYSRQWINLGKFAIGEHELGISKIYLFKLPEDLGNVNIEGILGMDFLRGRILFLDFKTNKLFLGPQEFSQ